MATSVPQYSPAERLRMASAGGTAARSAAPGQSRPAAAIPTPTAPKSVPPVAKVEAQTAAQAPQAATGAAPKAPPPVQKSTMPQLILDPERGEPPVENVMERIRRRTFEPLTDIQVIEHQDKPANLASQEQLPETPAPVEKAVASATPPAAEEPQAAAKLDPAPEPKLVPAAASQAVPAARLSPKDRLRAASVAATTDLPESDYFPSAEHDDEESVPTKAASPAAPAGPRLSPMARLRAASVAAAASLPDGDHFGPSDNGDEESSSARAVSPVETMEGTLNSVKEFNGWAVGSLWTEERVDMRVTGESLMGLIEGLEYSFKGRRTDHATYGEGFEVISAQPVISPNDAAIERYLVRSFKGIGTAKAGKYLKEVREEGGDEAVEKLRNTLLNEPWTLDLTKIAKEAKFAEGEDSQGAAKQLMVTRNLMLRLGAVKGFRESTAKSLASYLVNVIKKPEAKVDGEPAPAVPPIDVVTETWAALMLNPYAPIRKAEGYGFATAEMVASISGTPRDSPLRLGALVEYGVEQGCQRKGHSYLRQGDFVEAIRKVDPTAPQQKALTFAVQQGLVSIDGGRVYPQNLLKAEKSLAESIAMLLQPAAPLTKRSFEEVVKKLSTNPEKINATFKNGFDIDQINAVAGLLTRPQRIHVLTGGAGTGKTALMEVQLALLLNKAFKFCAPTGKAAKVLTARVASYSYGAFTVHSTLKGSEEEGFKVNENEPLECDVLVVDENTMNGIVMGAALLKALPAHAHVIFLGDPGLPGEAGKPGTARGGQLPSISPGRFMQDLLLVPGIHHVNLTKTYRNSGGILEVIDEVARGVLNPTNRDAVTFSGTLPEAEVGFPGVMSEYLGRVAADGIENTFLVMPMRKGERDTPGWNTTYANHVLRQACNPYGERLPGATLHLGDRIMIRENITIEQPIPSDMGVVRKLHRPFDFAKLTSDFNARLGVSKTTPESEFSLAGKDGRDEEKNEVKVVNGDTGTIIAYAMSANERRLGSPKWIRLALDDGREVEFPGADMASIDHAYAGTVHATQGSEYMNVIMVVTPGSPEFMNQNMLITGMSRPKVNLSIHADDHAIRKIAATPLPPRNSGLVQRVVEQLEAIERDAEGPAEVATPDLQF